MSNKTVAHFIRKDSQLKASFIKNQILYHKNYNPVIIALYRSDNQDGGFADLGELKSVPILILRERSGVPTDAKYKYLKLINKNDQNRIIEFLLKHNVLIMHFHFGTDAGLYLPRLKNFLPSVVSMYGYDCTEFPKKYFGMGKRFLNKRVFNYANIVTAMSRDMHKDILSLGCNEKKIRVHYHGSIVEKFYVNRTYDQKDTIEYLIISGLVLKKGHEFLLKSFKRAVGRQKNLRLHIVGDGPLKEHIITLIRALDLSEYVVYHGPVTYNSSKHIELLEFADVFIHPSITDKNGDKEGIPGAIVEAMASGLPIISTYHAGIPEIIVDNFNGFLVKENNEEQLAISIEKISNINLQQKFSENSLLLSKNLSIAEKEKQLEMIYDEIIN